MFYLRRKDYNSISTIQRFKYKNNADKVCDYLNKSIKDEGCYPNTSYFVVEEIGYYEEVKCAAERAAQA